MNTTDTHAAQAVGGRRSLPRRSPAALIIPLLVLFATVAVLVWSAWPSLRPTRAVTVMPAVFDRTSSAAGSSTNGAVTLAAGRPRHTVQAPGWLEADPFYIACAALADGVIEHLDVLEGDTVTAGQVVARLVARDAELQLSRADANRAISEAELSLAGAELFAAQTDWDNPVERERAVATAQAAVAEAQAELNQLPSIIAAARAIMQQLDEESDRIERSRESGAATPFEAMIARRRAEAQRSTVTSHEDRQPLLAARLAREQSSLHAAERHLTLRVDERRRLAAAQATVLRARASVQQTEAAWAEAALELERMTIRSPIDGVVQRRLKVPGDKVVRMMDDPNSSHVVHLYDPSQLQVRCDVPLAEAANVIVGQTCEVIVEVLPDEIFAGTVTRITHEADLQKNTLQVKVHVTDPSPLLRPEMLTRVKFLVTGGNAGASINGALPATHVLVPDQAIVPAPNGPHLWVVRDRRGDQGTVVSVPVKIVKQDKNWVTVAGAIHPGDLLAINATDLTDGEHVTIASDRTESSS